MTFKEGDRVTPVDYSLGAYDLAHGDMATVLTMRGDVAWVYPDKWKERVPYEYEHRCYQGLPYLRFFPHKLMLKKVCIFEEVVPIKA